jgi:hypothetical protein
MASFDFVLIGAHLPQRVDVPADDLGSLAAYISTDRFVSGELPADEWGQVRRVLIPTCRIQMIVEGE